jgi:amino acid adenylation domain-containing protein/non-ribosomal peptide synthase protein (TIGR01720 family)
MEDFSERLSSLSPAQRALLELRLRKNRPPARPTIPPRPQAEHYPLSWDQERLWFIQQLDQDSYAYNIYSVRRFKGSVDIGLLTRCLNEIVRRHEILRTGFVTEEGRPVQLIAPHLTVNIPVVDLRGLPVAEREAEASRVVTEQLKRPFDLARLPIFRTALVRLDEDDYVCPTIFHHIVIDWVSFQLFERELAVLYSAFGAGKPSPLPELPIQYADFATWQRRWVDEQEGNEHLDYWRHRLADVPLVLDLPTDRPRPPVQNPWGVRQPLVLSKSHSDAVRVLARQEGVTMFICLLAIFKALLFRHTGQEQIIVGSPAANREGNTEELLGYFLNHLAFCTDLSGDPTFRELLRRVRETALGAYTHQNVPFGKLVETLQPHRTLSRTPITQVVFLLLNTHQQEELKFPGFEVLPYWADSGAVDFDMTFSLWDSAAGLNGWLEYNTDLFDTATIIRTTEHFRNLVAAVTADPDRPLSQLPMLSGAESHQLLVEWGAATPVDVAPTNLVELFEAQVVRTPEAVALIAGNERLTYGELNGRANQLAHHLRSLGVRPETVVGVLMSRSADALVGLLGVLKAGGVYLPLDPAYPRARHAFMLADAGASVLLTQERVEWDLPARCSEVLYPTGEVVAYAADQHNPPGVVSGENLAYLIYTSGSTGEPKGVGITHAAAARHIANACELYRLRADDNVLQFASHSFDAALEQVFTALLIGATVVLRGDELWSSAEFVERVREHHLTVIDLPPIYWQELVNNLDEATAHELAGQLRLVIVGGDLMPPAVVNRWRNTPLRAVRLLNAYGPTEATITSLCHEVQPDLHTDQPTQSIAIGRPLAGRSAYILDQRGQPVAIGVTGELHIGGQLLARGYMNRPALTAEQFIPDTFDGMPGARLYKTGDLARYLPNGEIEFIGRRDHQVKLRGFRIELGEVETALRTHPAVREAIVVAREEASFSKRLIAYITTAQQSLGGEELRNYLKSKLPDYMLPDVFITLAEWPLTKAGKIDRRALPPPDGACPAGDETFVAPRTPIERKLAAIWCRVLNVGEVGVHDNFFALGGDSIHSIQIVARANQEGIRLTPKQIFQHQTIAELAGAADTTEAIEAEQGTVEGQVPLTAIQSWFFERKPIDPHHFNQALLLEVDIDVQLPALEKAIAQLVLHHDALRLRFVHTDEGWTQTHAQPDTQPLLLHVDLSACPDEQHVAAVEATAAQLQASLNLMTGPLVRTAFFDLGLGQKARLLIIIHHLVVDGVSWRILMEDLQTAYRQASRGEEINLPPKTTSFKQWSEALADYARSDEVAREMEYWTAQSSHQVNSFAVDHHGEANTAGSADTVLSSLSIDETRMLLEAARALRIRVDVLMLTALAQSYVDATGEHSLLIHLEGHGREEIIGGVDLSRTVGWFTSLSPVLLELKKNISTADALGIIAEQLRAIPHRGIGYGLLRYVRGDAAINERLETLARAEVSFNYLGHLDQVLPESSPFKPAPEHYGAVRSPRAHRPYLLDLVAGVSGNQLRLFWSYSRNLHRPATIEALAAKFTAALKAIAAHYAPANVSAQTPAVQRPLQPDDRPPDELTETGWQTEASYHSAHAPQGLEVLPLRPVMATEPARPTAAQAQLWALDQLLPGLPFFNIYIAMHLRGPLNPDALARSLNEVVRRHENLRTTFAVEDGRTVLHISPHGHSTIPLVDLSALSESARENELLRLAIKEARHPFDLAAAPLLRLTLLRLGETEHRLMFTIHHIIADAWSIGVFVSELTQLYVAFCEQRPSPLPELTIQWSDYTRWQHEWLQTETAQQQLDYWMNKLGGQPTPLNLPTDYPRSDTPGFETAQVFLLISPELSATLKDFSRREGLSLFMLLLTAFKVLLYNYTGREEIRVGTLAANRNHVETERLIGLFVNTLIIHTRLSPELTYRQLLHHVGKTVLEAFSNQELPFEHLMQALGAELDLEQTPLFDVLFVMQNAPVPSLDLPGLKLDSAHDEDTLFESDVTLTTFDLILMVTEGQHGLSASLRYKSDLFRPATVNRMLEDFQAVLKLMVEQPKQQLAAARLSNI